MTAGQGLQGETLAPVEEASWAFGVQEGNKILFMLLCILLKKSISDIKLY